MKLARRQFLQWTGAAVAAPAVARVAWGQTPQVTLKMHHFLPPVSNGHAKLLAPWARKVEAESGGRIKIDIFPSMQLGGTPPQLFDQARDGVVDFVWTLPGSTPGRFPGHRGVRAAVRRRQARACRTPRRCRNSPRRNLRDEFKEVHPICLWAHDHGLIHANKPIKTMDDLKGLQAALADAAGRRRAEGARRQRHPDADPATARGAGAARARRLRDPVGGGAGRQGARAAQVPHRDPGLADALHGDLHPRDEQGEVRSRCRPI